MTNIQTLDALAREKSSKGATNALRNDGKIPAVVYGGKEKGELSIALDAKEFNKLYLQGHFMSKVLDLKVADKTVRVLPRDIQLNPVNDTPIHIDFMRIDDSSQVKVNVKIVFRNAEKSPGLKRGGVLNIVRRDVELLCKASNIPAMLEIDLDGKQIGESIHVSQVSIPENCEPTITDRDFTIATIVGRTQKTEEASETEGEEAEGEEASEDSGEEASEE